MDDKPIAAAIGTIGTPNYPALKEKLGDEAYRQLLDLLQFATSSAEARAQRLERDSAIRDV